MDKAIAIIILCEVLLTLFAAWGILHEDLFVAFEHRLWKRIKYEIRMLRSRVLKKHFKLSFPVKVAGKKTKKDHKAA